MKKYRTGKFSKELGVTVQALWNWDKSGKLKPEYVASFVYHQYSQRQLDQLSGSYKPEQLLLCSVLGFKVEERTKPRKL